VETQKALSNSDEEEEYYSNDEKRQEALQKRDKA
jgi:hypothetical protein